jgi:hypothetical protein
MGTGRAVVGFGVNRIKSAACIRRELFAMGNGPIEFSNPGTTGSQVA